MSPDRRVKITPRIGAQVARRLRLAASVRARSMSAVVNEVLDEALPSLEEIRMQLGPAAGGETAAHVIADIIASRPGPVVVTTARGTQAGPQAVDGRPGDGSVR